jgi:hypothetical protein
LGGKSTTSATSETTPTNKGNYVADADYVADEAQHVADVLSFQRQKNTRKTADVVDVADVADLAGDGGQDDPDLCEHCGLPASDDAPLLEVDDGRLRRLHRACISPWKSLDLPPYLRRPG